MDTIDLNTVLDDSASRSARRSIFLWEAMDIMEFFVVIILVLEVQIYYYFSLLFLRSPGEFSSTEFYLALVARDNVYKMFTFWEKWSLHATPGPF